MKNLKKSNQKMIRKAFFISILSISAILNLCGQIQKKTIMAGGEIDIPLKFNANGYINTEADFRFGYFVVNNLCIGVKMESEFNFLDGGRSIRIGAGPMIRYYIGKQQLMMFGHLSYVPSIVFRTSTVSNEFISHLKPGLGISYMLRPTISIEALLCYDHYNSNHKFKDSFSLLQIGINIFIPHNNTN